MPDPRQENSLTPYVIEETSRGERSMDVFSRLLKDRIIFIGQDINDQVANVVIAQLLILKMEDPKKDIHIYLNVYGGQINAGLAIYDTLRYLDCAVNTYCIGLAASVGALLIAAGTKGKRFSLPNSRLMLHQPIGGVGGTSADVQLQAKEILHLKRRMSEIMAECTGQPTERIISDSERDFYMSPEEAKAYGIIDEIIVSQKKLLSATV